MMQMMMLMMVCPKHYFNFVSTVIPGQFVFFSSHSRTQTLLHRQRCAITVAVSCLFAFLFCSISVRLCTHTQYVSHISESLLFAPLLLSLFPLPAAPPPVSPVPIISHRIPQERTLYDIEDEANATRKVKRVL